MARRAAAAASEPSNVPDETWAGALTFLAEHEVLQARLNAKKSAAKRSFEVQGVDWGAVQYAHGMKKLDRPEIESRLAANARALRVAGIAWEASGQGTMVAAFTVEAGVVAPSPHEARLAAARAHGDGYNSGRAGATLDTCPFAHAPGSEEFVRWRDGWQDGQADRRLVRPDQDKVTKAAGRRRGKAGGAQTAPAHAEREPAEVF